MTGKNIVKRIDRNLARRLREARKEVGLSVRAVANKLPRAQTVSHTTIAGYENGVTVPPIDVLAALAVLYKRPVNWFLDSREMLSGFRYRNLQSRVPLADQRHYAAQASRWAEAYLALEKHLRTSRQRLNVVADVAELPGHQAAAFVRTKFLNLDDAQPLVDTIDALESFPAWAIELRARFGVDSAAARLGDKQVVVMNPDVSNERARLNVAFELGYVLLTRDESALCVEVERQAQAFACSLLLPDSQLERAFEGRSFLTLIKYKERFGVSLAAMIHRAEELKIINTSASRWLRSEMAKKGWRRNEPGYVWRDRAITFETILESAIHMKKLTWEEAERVTSIPQDELKRRLAGVIDGEGGESDRKEEQPAVLKLVR